MGTRRSLTALAVLVLGAAGYAGARSVGPVPPLGPLLDPANGAWAAAATAELPRRASGRIPGLASRVNVVYDDRGVPHIFATSEEDAVRALGYVVARDRLFQLELQTRVASGRLTELVGAPALALDREMRALGFPRSAARKLAAISPTSDAGRALQAYADGVNAWVDAMRPRDVPLEYRLLGALPTPWEPINSIHLLNRMGWTLAYDETEQRKLRARALVGGAAADALFPVNSPIQEPIEPNGRSFPRFDRTPLPPPGVPDTQALDLARIVSLAQASGWRAAGHVSTADAPGSNNWAVAPRRTAHGFALLAGDPHLELTLPSIWYEAHLVVPGRLDVYGVTIPGAPWIVIGFNRDVAWTFTNTDADVLDFYEETVDDTLRPTRYRFDGVWRPLERRVETYRGRSGEPLAADTVAFTHRGPVKRVDGRWLSMRWTVLEPSTETEAFLMAARATTAGEWLEAMTRYLVPSQNMLVADRAGTIAIRSTGRFPVRPGDGRGDVIRDGTSSHSDWLGGMPVERYPTAVNPAQGFLASANQQPVDPATDSAYLGADWFAPWRAMRVNTLLRADSAVTPDAMRRYQTDPGSTRADFFVPHLLAAADRAVRAGGGSPTLREAARLLAGWDRRYTIDNERAVLFELAMEELVDRTWDELLPPGASTRDELSRVGTPQGSVLALLFDEPGSAWWDDRSTTRLREDRDAILVASLEAALARARREHGELAAGGWRWDRIRHANIYHLLGIPAFSALAIPVQGGPSTLNPSGGAGTEGASWRMVVEMGPEVRAWVTYPGGQSGNPASSRYTDRLGRWTEGELDSVLFPQQRSTLPPNRVAAELTLEPAR